MLDILAAIGSIIIPVMFIAGCVVICVWVIDSLM